MTKQTPAPNSGLTLLESLLVLVIMSAIFIFSMNQYQSMSREAEVRIVQSNVDLLFDAMVKHFRANCNSSPFNAYYSNEYYPVTIQTLITEKALTVPSNVMQFSTLVDNTRPDQGYILQFNQIQDPSSTTQLPIRDYPGPWTFWVPIDFDHTSPYAFGSIVGWRIQVSVALRNKDTAKTTTQMLGANCLSASRGGSVVTPCSATASKTIGTFAVWERLPSNASSQGNSPNWISKPTLSQFKQMYETYPVFDLYDGTIPKQIFYCGGQ